MVKLNLSPYLHIYKIPCIIALNSVPLSEINPNLLVLMLFPWVCLNEWLPTATTLLPSLESVIIHSLFTPSLPTSHIWILFFKRLNFSLPLVTNLVMLSLILLWISTSYHYCLTSHCSLHFRQIISFPYSFFKLIYFLLKDNCFTEFFCFMSDLNINHIPSFLKLFSNVILSKLLYFYLLHWHLNSSCNLSKTLSLHICFLCV